MIIPPFLKPGDIVGIVAPAKRLQSGIEDGVRALESWGLQVRLGQNLFNESNLFAGTDSERATDLQEMLDNPEIKAILMARGGYGTTRIIDDLDFTLFKKSPKWISGFSDVTVLLQKLQNMGYASIHSTVPVLMGRKEHSKSDTSLKKALLGEPLSHDFQSSPFNRNGEAKGPVCGGNLSMICNSIGTSSEIDTKNRVLVIEDVGEYLYHLDRMMVQLKRSGKFEGLSGLIIGHFTNMKDHSDTFGLDYREIILSHVDGYDFPVAFGLPSGHEAPNLAIYMGVEAEMKVSDQEAVLNYKSSE